MPGYGPGEWLAVVTPRTVALLPSSLGERAAGTVWKALSNGDGFGAVLGALVEAFGTSMTALPSFAAVTRDVAAGTVNVVARGSVRVGITAADGGAHEVSGLGVTTWQERTVVEASRVVIGTPGTADAVLPVRDGVVFAGCVDWILAVPGGAETEEAENAYNAEGAGKVDDAEVARNVEEASDARKADEPDEPDEPNDAGDADEATVLPDETESADDLAAEAEPELADHTTGYDDFLYGKTRMTSVEEAAVRGGEPAAMILGIPRPEASTAPPALGDHDGETVSAEQLAALLRQQEPLPAGSGPAGPLPAGSKDARRDSAPSRSAVLVVSDGQRIPLDRGAVIGRRPRALRATGAVPHLVTVSSPSQDVSRSHVELRVDGADIVAVDLDTVNGTKLLRQGAEPLRLHPGEQTLLVAGDRLDLGDGVVLDFEGLR